ncbi:SPOR domain-containing protein [Pseudohongiella sp. O18]|uniref:SPOR domain-containing protein n=1 Tax=Pseudohongiella sp. O18 TaxID=2904248 RepID=UPI001F016397|nr:SPOR domain-containing protein [Pseudohongiella sp. O18]
MEQDFAKRRIRTPLAEPSPPPRSSGLALLLTGLMTGVVIGLFLGLLIYMSGMLPPAPGQQMADATPRDSEFLTQDDATVAEDGLTAEQEREAARLQLEFYQELPNYEVVVDVTPLPVPASQRSTPDPTTEPPAESSNAPATAESTTATVVATSETVPPSLSNGAFLLQAGAFQQQGAASAQLNRLLALGLDARIRQENMPNRTLYLVQAGPYDTREQMLQAESTLRGNNIDTMRITLNRP